MTPVLKVSRRDILFIVSIVIIPIGILANARYSTLHEAEEAINKKLINTDGAQFRNIRRTKTGTICGEVNAKNNNGEYQGFRFFYVSNLTKKQTVWLDSGAVNLAKKMCNIE